MGLLFFNFLFFFFTISYHNWPFFFLDFSISSNQIDRAFFFWLDELLFFFFIFGHDSNKESREKRKQPTKPKLTSLD